ncbi:MAG: hypothetical protein ACREQY_13645, partial [Candidatus Binatia bacterium]
LALFTTTYRTLRRLESRGPPDLLWLTKGVRVGFVLFLLSSLTADIWLNELLYVIVAFTIALERRAGIGEWAGAPGVHPAARAEART